MRREKLLGPVTAGEGQPDGVVTVEGPATAGTAVR